MITIRFWGVRGSIGTSGMHSAAVGGNTSCVEIRCDDRLLILDAGTGLRLLGTELARRGAPIDASLLLSHFHWDHIQGFPFFTPAYVPGNRIKVYGAAPSDASTPDVRSAFVSLMKPPHFPVGLDAINAELDFSTVAPGQRFAIGEVAVTAASLRHPNGCIGYRLDYQGRSVVYATDTEHDAASGRLDENLLALCRGADVLIYDAQYTAEEYAGPPARPGEKAGPRGKQGWGHSTAEEGARLAMAAGVSQLVLFHHDPWHDDFEVARIEAVTQSLFANTCAAREGQVIALRAVAGRVAA